MSNSQSKAASSESNFPASLHFAARESAIVEWVATQMASADSGHGIDHVRRVVQNALQICKQEKNQVDLDIVLPAAWLHDCVMVPKNSPQRSQASRLAADEATRFLESIEYPGDAIPKIAHCILSHSFSAGIPCETLEARVVQDADRLEAVGAIGIARCLMTGGGMQQRLYHPDEPFPATRTPADSVQSIDHFFVKLLGLAQTMQTESGRQIAIERTQFMISFLEQLSTEIGGVEGQLQVALNRLSATKKC